MPFSRGSLQRTRRGLRPADNPDVEPAPDRALPGVAASQRRRCSGRPRLSRLAVGATLFFGVASCDTTPETPENAVMDYLTAEQLGKTDEAEGRLCERLRKSPGAGELEVIHRVVHKGSVFGEGVIREDQESAVVALEVVFAPSPPAARGEPWEAHLVREDGRWKVCGLQPAGD